MPPRSQGSPSGPQALSSAGLKPGRHREEPGAEAPPTRATEEGPGSPCRENVGSYIHSFIHSHFLYARTALSTTEERGQSNRDPDVTMGVKSYGQAALSHSRSVGPFDTEEGLETSPPRDMWTAWAAVGDGGRGC